MPARKPLDIGAQFHSWTVLAHAPPDAYGKSRYVCRCQCGIVSTLLATLLRRKETQSCGCDRDEPDYGVPGLCAHKVSRVGIRAIYRSSMVLNLSFGRYLIPSKVLPHANLTHPARRSYVHGATLERRAEL